MSAVPILGSTSALRTAESERLQPKVKIVLVGDSTVAEESGWGPGLRHLAREEVEVVNLAANGRSSKSFIDEGLWAKAIAARGKYCLIQFGHNDEPGKGPERETDPKTSYRAFMARYVDETRGIGATPVLITSLVRRIFNADGTIKTTQTPYVEAVRALAAEKHVPLVDLHAITLADDKGQIDRTHLNAKGSDVVGRMVAQGLLQSIPELGALFRVEPAGKIDVVAARDSPAAFVRQ
jgi:pectinesterase